MIGATDLARRFTYHPPDETRAEHHETIRELCLHLAETIDALCPDSREKSLAVTRLEESMMWANAAIAREGR